MIAAMLRFVTFSAICVAGASCFAEEQSQCPERYLVRFSHECRGEVIQPHDDGGYSFKTTSIRRRHIAGRVDEYEACVKNISGRALAVKWSAALMFDVIVPDGCAFPKPRPDNFLSPEDDQPAYMDTCIKFGNHWEKQDIASYLPPNYARAGLSSEPQKDCPGTQSAQLETQTGQGEISEILSEGTDFAWTSQTVFDTDPDEDNLTLAAFVVETRLALTSGEKSYQHTIDYFIEELDEGAFEKFAGLSVTPIPQMQEGGWTEENSALKVNEKRTFTMFLDYFDTNARLQEAAMQMQFLENPDRGFVLYVPFLNQ